MNEWKNDLKECPFCETSEGVLLCMSKTTFEHFTENGKPTWVFCTCINCGLTVRSKETLDYEEAVEDLTKRWNGLRYEEDN